jgi:hypothetical protein
VPRTASCAGIAPPRPAGSTADEIRRISAGSACGMPDSADAAPNTAPGLAVHGGTGPARYSAAPQHPHQCPAACRCTASDAMFEQAIQLCPRMHQENFARMLIIRRIHADHGWPFLGNRVPPHRRTFRPFSAQNAGPHRGCAAYVGHERAAISSLAAASRRGEGPTARRDEPLVPPQRQQPLRPDRYVRSARGRPPPPVLAAGSSRARAVM